MTENYLMSLDIGGSGGRCMLVKPETGEITVATRAWRHPANPTAGVWSFDLDTDLIWSLLREAIGEVCPRANVRAEQIAAIAVTGMRHGLVVVDAQGNPLMTHANIDARAVEQSMILAGEYGEVLYERSGHWPAPINGAPVLLWMKEHLPEAMLDASAVLSVSDWVAYRLTGEMVFEATQAAETTLFDLRSGDWAADLIVEFGLRREIFPRLVTAGERLGALLAGAAAQLGLEAGIPVVVGGADTQSGMLGVGALAPGQLGVIAGTTAPIQLVSDKALVDPEKRLWTSVHLVRGRYVLESNAGAMGNALEWIAGALYPGLPDPVPALLAEAARAPAGASGVISTLGASLFNASDLSLPVDNFSFSTANRQPSDGERSFLVRAVVEGLAYSVRANIEQIQRVGGDDVMTIYVGGGFGA